MSRSPALPADGTTGRERLELLIARSGSTTSDDAPSGTRLLAPMVGSLTFGLRPGDLVGAGQTVGTIDRLGQRIDLVIPPGVAGRVSGPLAETRQQPTAYGDVVLTLEPIEGAGLPSNRNDEREQSSSDWLVRAPQSGRFYSRPSPEAPPFVETGDQIELGTAVGLLEVMKTFAQVRWQDERGRSARVVRYLVDDGTEVTRDQPLLELEPTD